MKNTIFLKQDLQPLVTRTAAVVIFVILFGGYLLPIEIALRNPIVFVAVLSRVVHHYYKKYQRLNYRLTKGWTVRGNVTE